MSLIQDTAQTLMEEAEFDLAEAKRLARAKIAENAALVVELWQYAIDRLLEDIWRSGRADHWRHATAGAPAPARASGHRVLEKGETSKASPAYVRGMNKALTGLMAFPMPTGRMLGDYQKAELDALASQVIAMARGTMATGFFFKQVAEMLPKATSRVRDVLTNNDLERIMRHQGDTKALSPVPPELPQTV